MSLSSLDGVEDLLLQHNDRRHLTDDCVRIELLFLVFLMEQFLDGICSLFVRFLSPSNFPANDRHN
jgi:hypothetical protein